MTIIVNNGLSAPHRPVIMRAAVAFAALVFLCSFATTAAAQEQPQGKRDDLDVTMQIIVDPDAKLPDEVVRRIPLPTRKSGESPPSGTTGGESGKPESAGAKDKDKEDDRSNEAREQGRETSEAAKERSREAAEQREAARRAEAEERRRERGPPDDRPNPPNRPPRN